MAVECLAVQLIGLKRDGEAFPVSSPVDTVDPVAYAEELGAGKPSDYFVNLISVDADEYAKLHFNKSVRKNLTIPEWMNEKALAQGINFSQVLQEALLERLQA